MEYLILLGTLLPTLTGVGNLLGWVVNPFNRQLGPEELRLLATGAAGLGMAFVIPRAWRVGCVSRIAFAIALSFVLYLAWGLLVGAPNNL